MLDQQEQRDRRIRLRAVSLESERERRDRVEGQGLARRLFVAAVLLVLTAVGCFVVLPGVGLDLPLVVPVVAFVAIATGALLTGQAEGTIGGPASESAPAPGDEGCAVGCCAGPRPPRFTR